MLSEEILLNIGFKNLPHFTIGNIMTYNLTRNRSLSIGSAGTPNEMLTICEHDNNDYKKITDIIVLHNYDYDGYLSESKLNDLINWFNI
jgi:hypothetical protein